MRFMSSAVAHTVQLIPHAPLADGSVQSLEVHIERARTQAQFQALRLRYVLHANLGRLRIPEAKPQQRTDELWKHTCFEAFLRASEGAGYTELNVAPSTEWALYSFDDYRKGMAPANVPQPPEILIERTADRLTLDVQIHLKLLPPSRALALAAVLEHDSGSLSYWALKHPAAQPDFHHASGFAFEI
jgi:hypothetical protein